MTDRESAADIDAQAAGWVVRSDRGELTAEEAAQLDAWRAGDPRCEGAYMRACAAWAMLDRAHSLKPEAAAPRQAALSAFARRDIFALFGGLAAAACAGVVVGPRLLSVQYATALGEIRRVPLADGSMAAINTSTSVAVSIRPTLRRVRLERGEAWFQVAKEPERPFVVESGEVRVRAVGTAFSVRRRQGGCDVLVTEGVVEAWSQSAPGERVRLAAGERAFVSDAAGAGPAVDAGPTIVRKLAWREGQIILEGDGLAEAVAEFNRYNQRKIIIADPSLNDERLVGWFRTNDPEDFAKAAAATLGAGVRITDDAILIHVAEKTRPV